ncbi:hypothetical protein O1L60_23740 [Streptomyces diastatochromogenes]|nr:hypothetical protein [Streptomyces diastatochromogenes]
MGPPWSLPSRVQPGVRPRDGRLAVPRAARPGAPAPLAGRAGGRGGGGRHRGRIRGRLGGLGRREGREGPGGGPAGLGLGRPDVRVPVPVLRSPLGVALRHVGSHGRRPPPGYHGVEDPEGFTIAVPEGWNRTESDQGVFYNAPDGLSLVQVFVVKEAGLTPYEALRGASEDGRTNKPGYEELSLERVTGEPGAPADSAELVYSYDRAGGRRKVVDRAFTAPDGTHYAILAAGPETSWPQQRDILRVALDYFTPGTP